MGKLWDKISQMVRNTEDKTIDVFGRNIICGEYPSYRIVDYAYGLCVKIVSNLVADSQKSYFKKGKKQMDSLYYQLNVEPNPNQSAKVFWHKLIHNMFYNNGEALVVKIGGNFYVCDDFTRINYTFKENEYRNIVIDELALTTKPLFLESDIFYFNIRDWLKDSGDKVGGIFEDIMSVVATQYKKKKYNKSVITAPSVTGINSERNADSIKAFERAYNEFISSSKDSVFFMDGRIDVGKYEGAMGEGYVDDAPNIINFTNETMQFMANLFNLPLGALKGEDVSLNNHINLFLKGLLGIIEMEFNRKLFNKYDYLKGTRISLSPPTLNTNTPYEHAQTNDLKIRSGVYSINEIRLDENLEEIEEDWANTHFMTLNYDVVNKFLDGTQGSGNKNIQTTEESEVEEDGEE